MNNSLYGKDILSTKQFTKDEVEVVLQTSREFEKGFATHEFGAYLSHRMMTALFYEPSSRTYGSFLSAMQRLGGGCIPIQGVAYSSVAKGETFEDTVRTFASYSDVLVLRYPHVGGAALAADLVDIPVINAGDGNGEHPTHALMDMYTILSHIDRIQDATITLVGDLLNGRTVHSLVWLLTLFSPKAVHFVSPGVLSIPEEYRDILKKAGVQVSERESLEEVIGESDVIYVTRVQKERFKDLDIYERLKHHYVISPDTMKRAKKTAILMHPFPRVGEILPTVDSDPRAVYLREQIRNGMIVRMALLARVLNK